MRAADRGHRIEVRDSDKRVRVSHDGVELAHTTRAKVLHESGLPPRYYIPREDVTASLIPSDHHTTCPWKGKASYWSVRVGDNVLPNLIWYYPEAKDESAKIAGMLAFYDDKVQLEIS